MLTDLEFRVWVQYILSADDFGVMRKSAVTVQADNDHLANRPRKVIDRCLKALCENGLLNAFDHQGRRYVYQRDWQTFQKVEYPRPTFEPKPPQEHLDKCDEKTRELFQKHPGGTAKRAPKASQTFSENSPKDSQEFPDYARARPRETAKANGLRQTANGSGKRPQYENARFAVWPWQFDVLARMLGPHYDEFDVIGFFDDLGQRTEQVIPADLDVRWKWLVAQVLGEAKRRGLSIASAEPAEPTNKRIAALIKGGEAFLKAGVS